MSLLITIFTLSLVTASSATVFLPARNSLPGVVAGSSHWYPLEDYPECDGVQPGQVTCADNCGTVLLCMGGSLPPTVLDKCVSPLVCSAEDRMCVNGTSTCNRPVTNITCHSVGVFPDPYDCTVYHICLEEDDSSIREQCESGWAYDPLTTECSKTPTDSVCTNLPIRCKSLGQTAAIPENPNIYYICVANENGTLIPELYRCPHGGTYVPDTYTCVDTTTTNATATPTTTSTTTIASLTPSTATPSTLATPSVGSLCNARLEIVADPERCYSYYECTVTKVWALVDCKPGYYFNKDQLKCVYGSCTYTYSSWIK